MESIYPLKRPQNDRIRELPEEHIYSPADRPHLEHGADKRIEQREVGEDREGKPHRKQIVLVILEVLEVTGIPAVPLLAVDAGGARVVYPAQRVLGKPDVAAGNVSRGKLFAAFLVAPFAHPAHLHEEPGIELVFCEPDLVHQALARDAEEPEKTPEYFREPCEGFRIVLAPQSPAMKPDSGTQYVGSE